MACDEVVPFREIRLSRRGCVCDAVGGPQSRIGRDGNHPTPAQRRAQRVDEVAVDDDRLGLTIVANRRNFVCRAMPVQRHEDRSSFGRCSHDLQLRQIVAHHQRDRLILATAQGD